MSTLRLLVADKSRAGARRHGRAPGLRGNPATNAITILVLSAGDAPMLSAALADGADRVLEKPCLPNDLEDEIRMCLERRRTSTEESGT
jgi:DNA-binding response OmpR family regulator